MKFMSLALKLAKKSNPSPNPRVGAVIVKGGKVLSTGYHLKAGGPHAEIVALNKLKNAKGSTMYVTLEPCSHYGKTPPCVDALINAGVKKVVCAMEDPNPRVNGIEKLRNAGISVEVGLMEEEAKKINEKFIKKMKTGLPFVAVKMAMSLDGKTATRTGNSKWISGRKSREFVQRLRKEYDAVMVGIETVLKDDPRLTCRIKREKDPLKIIVDSRLRIPLESKVLKNPKKVIVAASERYNKGKKKELEKLGVKIIVCGKEKVGLKRLMGKLNVNSILIEGGGEINASAVKEKIVDKFYFFVSPIIIGGRKAKTPVEGIGIEKISESLKLDMKSRKIGGDFLFEATF